MPAKETNRRSWDDVKKRRMASSDAREGYERARRAYKLAEQVRALREKAGLSQTELAQRMGSTQPAIARLEAGGVSPNIETLQRVADALHVELTVKFASPAKAS